MFYAVCDDEKEKIEECLKNYDVKFYLNYSDVLEDDEIDVVHICTPHFLHLEMIRDALLKGKEVISEKPLTMTLDKFNQLKAMKEDKNLGAVFQNRYNKCPIKFNEISKEMGKHKSAIWGQMPMG